MKLVFLSNFFNHHQKFLSDVLYEHLGDGYRFIETSVIPEMQKTLGYHSYDVPYVMQYNADTKSEIDRLILEADIVQVGEAPVSMIKERVKQGKLIVRDDERRYKAFIKYLKWPIYTYASSYYNTGYLLAASAFAPRDYVLSGMKPERCFKWGYFPELKRYESIEALFALKEAHRKAIDVDVTLLWVARLIDWKHPEAAVNVAHRLQKEGVNFSMNIIGAGPMMGTIKNMTDTLGLNERVHILGPVPPEQVRVYMEEADIFLFTSDQNEGWGVTLNESMNSGCAVVVGSMIGAVPFMVKGGENGLIYPNNNQEQLCEIVSKLVSNTNAIKSLGMNAYNTIINEWNPEVAGKNLITLYEALLNGHQTPIQNGPCSKAEILTSKWTKQCQNFYK